MTTATIAELIKLDQKNVVEVLKEAGKELNGAEGQVIVDFSSVEWIDSAIVRALEEFADTAESKSLKVALHGVSVGVYKVLKLVRLAPRFSFPA